MLDVLVEPFLTVLIAAEQDGNAHQQRLFFDPELLLAGDQVTKQVDDVQVYEEVLFLLDLV